MTLHPLTIGFTGTLKGMTPEQVHSLHGVLAYYSLRTAHHGMATGADAEFHAVVTALGVPTVGHPGTRKGLPYHRAGVSCTHTLPGAEMLTRNDHIVAACDLLIAAPAGTLERPRGSGTWATIRYARRRKRWHLIIWPDGSLSEHKP